jgi:hypothetical protein
LNFADREAGKAKPLGLGIEGISLFKKSTYTSATAKGFAVVAEV